VVGDPDAHRPIIRDPSAGAAWLRSAVAMDREHGGLRSTRRAWAVALAGIVAFSFSAALYKLSGAPPAVGSTFRFAYATLFLAFLAWRAGVLRVGPGFAPAVAAGVLVGVEVVIWNESTGRIGAGPSTVIVNTASLWVMALTVVVLRRPVGLRPVVGAVVVLGGLVLLRGTGEHRLELAGIALAVLAAAIYGAYLLVFDRAVRAATDGIAPVLWSSFVAALVSAACAVGLDESWDLSLGQHAWLALLGVGVQACGWLLIARSLSSFSAVAVSILLLLQPALAAVWGVAFLDETLIAIQVAGIAIVLAGVTIARPRAQRAADPEGARSTRRAPRCRARSRRACRAR
jgi:drug/metabolite transporter (DMT)-like permease